MRRKDSNYNFLFYMRVENTMELKKLLIIILYMYKLNKKKYYLCDAHFRQ